MHDPRYDTRAREQQQDTDPARPSGPSARQELYSALISGFGNDEQRALEQLVHDNEERLRETGDGYAP